MARNLSNDVLEEIILALMDDETVKLRGFGIFRIHYKKERPGKAEIKGDKKPPIKATP